jgi:hypothetical protein
MIPKILSGLAILVMGFLGYVALKPAESVISWEVAIQAGAERIFPCLNSPG